ncbi:MAG: translation initiation factor IF-2 [Ruminococcaceae bacterium]|nr:translation initiation factor IF-2 [Oscillospiraceae bacterium]
MAKREDSGAGLRAGFVRGDGLMQHPRKKEKPQIKEEEPDIKPQPPIPEPETEPEEPKGPTLTMQGVSGKKITGVVKVVKKARPDKPAAPAEFEGEPEALTQDADLASEKPTTPAAEPVETTVAQVQGVSVSVPPAETTAAPKQQEPVVPVAEKTTAEAGSQTTQPLAPAERQPQTPAETQPLAQKAKESEITDTVAVEAVVAPQKTQPEVLEKVKTEPVAKAPGDQAKTQPVRQPVVVPSHKSAEGPVRNSEPTARTADREHTGGKLGMGARPPRGPQSGRYLRQPQQPPQQQSQQQRPAPRSGDQLRPGFTSGRPQNSTSLAARGGLKIPAVPPEIQDKGTEPRGGIVARDAFDKTVKREDKNDNREPRKDAAKGANQTRDKHRVLKKQAQALSGKPVEDALSDEVILDTFYKEPAKSSRSRGTRSRRNQRKSTPAVRAVLKHVKLPATLTVKEFAEAIKKAASEVIKQLMKLGVMAALNQEIDFDTATLVAAEFNITTEQLVEVTEEDILFDDSEDDDDNLQGRPPVVVVMGHVDHGKTSILDRIRSASVAEGEAGGITQHIGAYTVNVDDRQITFLDTPGHEAFTTMRARGAQVTDIAILVVAADDGVMPQTVEAINHARAADTQIIVAINKIDKPGANTERVKQELTKYDLIAEDWGGATTIVPVSALTGEGIADLLEMVLLTADIMDLKSNPDKQAKGTIIEAKLDRNRGPVATLLVQRGTLNTGDTLVTGSIVGHIRAMTDDRGQPVREAGPSIPVEVIGLPEVPEAGELFYVVTDEKVARNLVDRRRAQQREQNLRSSSRMTLDSLFSQIEAGEVKELNIIVKADVQGSVEAVRQSLEKLANAEVRVNVIHGAVGAITESDIRLAEVSNAIVIGFNVRPAANVSDMAAESGVDLRMYRIIYQAIDDIEAAMKGMLAPKMREVVLGHAEVRQVFRVSGVGSIGGCYVQDGRIHRSCEIRVVRDGIVVHEGKLASLRRFKDDVREVAAGYECGIGIERFNDIKDGDIIEAFEMQAVEGS